MHQKILKFWFDEASPEQWFTKDLNFVTKLPLTLSISFLNPPANQVV